MQGNDDDMVKEIYVSYATYFQENIWESKPGSWLAGAIGQANQQEESIKVCNTRWVWRWWRSSDVLPALKSGFPMFEARQTACPSAQQRQGLGHPIGGSVLRFCAGHAPVVSLLDRLVVAPSRLVVHWKPLHRVCWQGLAKNKALLSVLFHRMRCTVTDSHRQHSPRSHPIPCLLCILGYWDHWVTYSPVLTLPCAGTWLLHWPRCSKHVAKHAAASTGYAVWRR